MKKFAVTGCFLGYLLVALLASNTASASEWLCNGGAITSPCTVIGENLESLHIEDMGVSSAIECAAGAVTTTGTVGSGVKDETKTMTFSVANCSIPAEAENLQGQLVANACEQIISIGAVNLPWLTEGVSEGGGVEKWDLIVSGTGGQAGLLVECKTKLGSVDDVCTTKEAATSLLVELKNLSAEGTEPALVTSLFLVNPLFATEALVCSVGGAGDGLIFGETLLAALNAGGDLISLEFDTP